MNKFCENVLYDARHRYHLRIELDEYGLWGKNSCPLCLLDKYEREHLSRIFNEDKVSHLCCWSCPLLSIVSRDKVTHLFNNCVNAGMEALEKWEDYFDGEDSKW